MERWRFPDQRRQRRQNQGAVRLSLMDDAQDAIRGIDEHLVTVDEGCPHPPRPRHDLHISRHDLPGRDRARVAGGTA